MAQDTNQDIEANVKGRARAFRGNLDFTFNGNPRIFPSFGTREKDNIPFLVDDRDIPSNDVAKKIPTNTRKPNRSLGNTLNRTLQQCWLSVFFRLPALYQSRMLQIGTDSGVEAVDLHVMSTTFSSLWRQEFVGAQGNHVAVSPELMHFKAAWEVLVDDLLAEWKTFNIISALLQTAIPVLLGLDNQSGPDPITRTGVMLSFICAGIALLCGSFCLLRFGSMRKMPKAAKWIQEAHKSDQLMWWNSFIVVSMPATWLAWAVLFFLATMMSYIWNNSFQNNSAVNQISEHTAQSLRITITAVLGFGILSVGALALSLSSKFGDSLDRKFISQVDHHSRRGQPDDRFKDITESPESAYVSFPALQSQSLVQLPPASSDFRRKAFPTTKLMDTSSSPPLSPQLPHYVQYRGQRIFPWDNFVKDLKTVRPVSSRNSGSAQAFPYSHLQTAEDIMFEHVQRWNDQVFKPNGIEAILCLEFPSESETDEGIYAVYVMDLAQARADGRQKLVDIFGPLPSRLRKIYLIDTVPPSLARRRGHPLGLTLEREIVDPLQILEPSKEQHSEVNEQKPEASSGPRSKEAEAGLSSQSESPADASAGSQPPKSEHPIDRNVTTVTTRPDPRQGKRANSAPQAVVTNSQSRRTSNNNTTVDNRVRARKRTDSSQKIRRR
ncbi:hypothetical protein GYMLUDRAFT_53064 [Collybiopsis luxurians FD-317 M1]|nr:hypothetical protein GYMLUDRAFT_53064 [Collybiopsis luxurians FD-317 M1]